MPVWCARAPCRLVPVWRAWCQSSVPVPPALVPIWHAWCQSGVPVPPAARCQSGVLGASLVCSCPPNAWCQSGVFSANLMCFALACAQSVWVASASLVCLELACRGPVYGAKEECQSRMLNLDATRVPVQLWCAMQFVAGSNRNSLVYIYIYIYTYTIHIYCTRKS